jgi:hypothetical protein
MAEDKNGLAQSEVAQCFFIVQTSPLGHIAASAERLLSAAKWISSKSLLIELNLWAPAAGPKRSAPDTPPETPLPQSV